MTSAAVPTVFVIDDDDLVRSAIQGMLKSVGLRSETFGTPQEFLRSKRSDGPSCLVLDLGLPGGVGQNGGEDGASRRQELAVRRARASGILSSCRAGIVHSRPLLGKFPGERRRTFDDD